MNTRTIIKFDPKEKARLVSMGVEALLLFGSHAQGLANPQSDYDFAVILKPKVYIQRKKIYDQLYDLLSEKINRLVDIDIVFMHKAPLELQNHVSCYGQILFQINDKVFVNFKQSTMIKYADFSPYRHMFQLATLDRIK